MRGFRREMNPHPTRSIITITTGSGKSYQVNSSQAGQGEDEQKEESDAVGTGFIGIVMSGTPSIRVVGIPGSSRQRVPPDAENHSKEG